MQDARKTYHDEVEPSQSARLQAMTVFVLHHLRIMGTYDDVVSKADASSEGLLVVVRNAVLEVHLRSDDED